MAERVMFLFMPGPGGSVAEEEAEEEEGMCFMPGPGGAWQGGEGRVEYQHP